jgi:hypothetical protein
LKYKSAHEFLSEEKIAKNHSIPLKSKNSSLQAFVPHALCSSDRFDFLTLHSMIFQTHFFLGASFIANFSIPDQFMYEDN